MDKPTVVLYHASCADGFGSAWAAWRHLGDAATYLPVQYGQDPPVEAESAGTLYILDFSYPRAVLERLAGQVDSLLVLDHHRTAEADLKDLPYARFDMNQSGAVMAWEHFHPGKSIPSLLLYIQDRDLWKWGLPRSREFSAALFVEPHDFEAWNWIARHVEFQDYFNRFTERGSAILAAQSQHVSRLCDKTRFVTIAGHRVPTVNSPLFQSEIGEELCHRHPDAPFAATYFHDGDSFVYSLRSRNGFDVSAVARSLGGGGHRAAAGFRSRDVIS